MGWKAETRAIEAAERRQQREAKKQQRELERRAKEMAKLSMLEQARLEVETYDNALDVLLSVHKEQTDPWNWTTIATSLPPVPPCRQSHNELKIRQWLAVSASHHEYATVIQESQQQDDCEYQDALKTHATEYAEWMKLSNLAFRILKGEQGAYIEAIQELSPFTELAGIGSSLHFIVHDAHMIECELSTNNQQAIPSEVKSLNASGKVTVKPMPRPRFIEIYQDYVCGCVLRVARELFALLPIDMVLVTALAESLDTSNGHMHEKPFLSVAISREILNALDFDKLDPSDSIMSLPHRGELKTSRKTGDFEFINALKVSDIVQGTNENTDFQRLLDTAKSLNTELASHIASLNPESENT